MHARLVGGAVSFTMVTSLTARNQIVPGGFSAPRTRLHVVQSQFRRRMLSSAILTGGMIAQQNILARQRAPLVVSQKHIAARSFDLSVLRTTASALGTDVGPRAATLEGRRIFLGQSGGLLQAMQPSEGKPDS